ncbi:MAG: GNAT family N-acetyltransferase [Clostridiales bacterium]|jgi:hypothetical protein|nr:GNAT family N-acetyltransferase [Clostridiales bacterium]
MQIESLQQKALSLNAEIVNYNWEYIQLFSKETGQELCHVLGETPQTDGSILIDDLWVRSDLRGKGLAISLMKEFENKAAENNCKSIRLFASGEGDLVSFYTKLGYTPQEPKSRIMIKDISHLKLSNAITEAKNRREYDHRGTTKFCFTLDDSALLYAPKSDIEKLMALKPELDYAIESGINTPRTLDHTLEDDAEFHRFCFKGGNAPTQPYGFMLQERAVGVPVHEGTCSQGSFAKTDKTIDEIYEHYMADINKYPTRLEEIANLSQEQIDSFVHGVKLLVSDKKIAFGYDEIGENVMFDKNAGLSFIDLSEKQGETHYTCQDPESKILTRLLDPRHRHFELKIQKELGRTINISEYSRFTRQLSLGMPPEWIKRVGDAYQGIIDKLWTAFKKEGLNTNKIDHFVNGTYGLNTKIAEWQEQMQSSDNIKKLIDDTRGELINIRPQVPAFIHKSSHNGGQPQIEIKPL